MEAHVSFTSAYGLTFGFMVTAFIMLVGGRQYYSMSLPLIYLQVLFADALQSEFLRNRMFYPKH